MGSRKAVKLFESRRAHLDKRLKKDYIRNGVAVIPCRVTAYEDVISSYSVKGCETLNPDFTEYLKCTAEVTPDEYPLVLNIIGDTLSGEEKATIDRIVRDDLFGNDLFGDSLGRALRVDGRLRLFGNGADGSAVQLPGIQRIFGL